MRVRPDTNMQETKKKKIAYPMAQFERSRLKFVQEGPKIKLFVEFVKA